MVLDIDEFLVDTSDLSGGDIPRPFISDFLSSETVRSADAVAFSRIPFWNDGYEDLPQGSSILQAQTLRSSHRPWALSPPEYTKNVVRTDYARNGGIHTPFSHQLSLPSRSSSTALDAAGNFLHVKKEEDGLYYEGVHTKRIIEPAAIYHMVVRDVADCVLKVESSSKICAENWRAEAKTTVSCAKRDR